MVVPIEWRGNSAESRALTTGTNYAIAETDFEVPFRFTLPNVGATYLSDVSASMGITGFLTGYNALHGTLVTETDGPISGTSSTLPQGDIVITFVDKAGNPRTVSKSWFLYAFVFAFDLASGPSSDPYANLGNGRVSTLDASGATIATRNMADVWVGGMSAVDGSPTSAAGFLTSGPHAGLRFWHAAPSTTWVFPFDTNPVGFYVWALFLPGLEVPILRQRQVERAPLRQSQARRAPLRQRQTY